MVVLAIVNAVGAAVAAGALFAFSAFVMDGLRRVPDSVGLEAMQGINLAAPSPIFMLVLFGMVEFGRGFNYWNDATHISAEGARFAVVNRKPDPEHVVHPLRPLGRRHAHHLRLGIGRPVEECYLNGGDFREGQNRIASPVHAGDVGAIELHFLVQRAAERLHDRSFDLVAQPIGIDY